MISVIQSHFVNTDSTTRKFTCGTHVCSPERRFWLLLSTNLGSRSVVRRLLWLCVVCCGVFVLRPIKRTTSSSSSTSNITLNLNRKPTVTPHTQPHPHSSPLRPTSLPTFPRISPSQPQTSLSLGLIVSVSHSDYYPEIRDEFGFYVAGIVILTLCVTTTLTRTHSRWPK